MWDRCNSFIETEFTSHTIHLFKVQFSNFWYIRKFVHPSLRSILERFYHKKRNHEPLSCHPVPIPLIATTYLLSVLQSYLFWTFHLSEVIHAVVFCDWLLSLNMMFSGFIQVGNPRVLNTIGAGRALRECLCASPTCCKGGTWGGDLLCPLTRK